VIQIGPNTNAIRVSLIRRDFSDCINSDVHATDPNAIGAIGGSVVITRSDSNYRAAVSIDKGTPNTTYNFFLKCHGKLGDVRTDARGVGSGSFQFGAGGLGPKWAFDMYPDGAPYGNKFQSEQVQAMH